MLIQKLLISEILVVKIFVKNLNEPTTLKTSIFMFIAALFIRAKI